MGRKRRELQEEKRPTGREETHRKRREQRSSMSKS
jgi:hypothetical protein